MHRLHHSTLAVSQASVIGLLARSARSIEALGAHAAAPIIHIGGDMPSIEAAIRNAGWCVNKLESLDILFDDNELRTASCLIIDISWSVLQNRALQELLSGLGSEIPFVCVVEEANLATAVALMKLGALDVMGRSTADETLIDAIRLGLRNSEAALAEAREVRQLKDRYDLLSQRERQILTLISSGLLNKQVAGELGISEITVKAHRGSLMRKMEARSFASLVKMAIVLDLQDGRGVCAPSA
jgi:FixJ family two-component response regulator